MPQPVRSITILVNNLPVELPREEATGLEIEQAAGVPLDFTLYLKHGTQLEEIADDQRIKLHEREEFVAVSGHDVS